jgi:argininosuccinate lyase
MLARDANRLFEARRRMNVLPLGSAALAGTSYPIDRDAVARALGFDSAALNSLDAVSERDFCIEFAGAAAILLMHLSRMAEDIILYTSSEFGFLELSDAVATGSSLMPQKKNPDSMELIRGKSGRVFGHLMGLLTVMKGLPLAYNKDMQEDKEAIFDVADTTSQTLSVTTAVLRNLRVDQARGREAAGQGYMNATELADYLVRKGVPFREAHETTGRVVRRAIEQHCELQELTLEELKSFNSLIEDDVFSALTLESTLATKSQAGGTAPAQVSAALAAAKKRIAGAEK